jgi:hypothetical protein
MQRRASGERSAGEDTPVGQPRAWFDGRGDGGWIVGRGRLLDFFAQFDDHGFSSGELAALRGHLAGPAQPRPTMRLPRQPLNG